MKQSSCPFHYVAKGRSANRCRPCNGQRNGTHRECGKDSRSQPHVLAQIETLSAEAAAAPPIYRTTINITRGTDEIGILRGYWVLLLLSVCS